MTIYTVDNDEMVQRLRRLDTRCSLSGQPVEVPFLEWRGSNAEIYINASSFMSESGTASPRDAGYGLVMDVVQLLDLATRLQRVMFTKDRTNVVSLSRKRLDDFFNTPF